MPSPGTLGDTAESNRSANATEQAAGFADADLPAAVEAVLLAMDRPVSPARIAAAVGLPTADEGIERVTGCVAALNGDYEREGRAFRIEKIAGGFRVMTLPKYASAVAAIHGMQASARLSRAAVETLAIIAYRQPITRADIEAIRGVACGEVLKGLLEKKLVTIAGRAEELGRPMLYGTTPRFLEAFGLASLKDLPEINANTLDAAAGALAAGVIGDGRPEAPGGDETDPDDGDTEHRGGADGDA